MGKENNGTKHGSFLVFSFPIPLVSFCQQCSESRDMTLCLDTDMFGPRTHANEDYVASARKRQKIPYLVCPSPLENHRGLEEARLSLWADILGPFLQYFIFLRKEKSFIPSTISNLVNTVLEKTSMLFCHSLFQLSKMLSLKSEFPVVRKVKMCLLYTD